jgi:hypothetical protein
MLLIIRKLILCSIPQSRVKFDANKQRRFTSYGTKTAERIRITAFEIRTDVVKQTAIMLITFL